EKNKWAIQEPDCPETRQVLPDWLADPLVARLMKWTAEKGTWDGRIAHRRAAGGSSANPTLPPAMMRKYIQWKEASKEIRVLFNKTRCCEVHHGACDPEELKKLRKQLLLVKLNLGDEVSALRLEAGNGASRQLVALKSAPCEKPVGVPDVLSKAPVYEAGLEDLLHEAIDPDNPESAEEEAALQEVQAEKEDSEMEIIAFSEDGPELT
ncbi:unnamed protein product, partial [Durusdinium trenchii]